MGRCPTDEQWQAFVRGGLEGQADALEAHLADCPNGCPAVCARLEQQLLRAEGVGGVPTTLRRRLAAIPAVLAPAAGPPVVAGYTHLHPCGRGGMSVVYSARDTAGATVALKFLDAAFASGADIERFFEEAQKARSVPGVVGVYDHGYSADHRPYLCLEYAAGGSLAAWGRSAVDPSVVAGVLATTADAVQRLHDRGVIHRDLKPSNILLRHAPPAAPDPLVADLGIAKQLTADTRPAATTAIVGTAPYIAPELLREVGPKPLDGSPQFQPATPASDVYALGATLFELLTGRTPFVASTTHGLNSEILKGHPTKPSRYNERVPAGLDAVCLKCLAKNPADRYPTAALLAADLRRFVAGETPEARLPSTVGNLRRWIDRNPVATKLFALLIGLLAAAGVAVWGLYGRWVKDTALADTRVRLAEEQKERAEEREQKATDEAARQKQAAHDTAVRAARAAAGRGDWPAALRSYAEAVSHQLPDETPLRVERLFGFMAVNDQATLLRELGELMPGGEPRPDLGPLAAKVWLVYGAHLLCDSDRQTDGRAAVRRALDQRGGLQSPADLHLAEALTETKPRPVIEALDRAVAADPYHYTAQSSLVVALLAAGETDRAVRKADAMEQLFPRSPVPPCVRAVIAVLGGGREKAKDHLREMAGRTNTDPQPLFKFLNVFADLVEDITAIEVSPDGARPVPKAFQKNAFTLFKEVLPADKPLAFAVPTIHLGRLWFEELIRTFMATIKAWTPQDLEGVARRLTELRKDHPDAMFTAMLVQVKLRLALLKINGGTPAAAAALLEAADLAYQGADEPTLIPGSDVRYTARCVGVLADLAALRFRPGVDSTALRRLRAAVPRLVADGARWPTTRLGGVNLIVEVMTVELTSAQEAEWKQDTPAGRANLRNRDQVLYHLGQVLLDNLAEEETREDEARSVAYLRKKYEKWWADRGKKYDAPPAGGK